MYNVQVGSWQIHTQSILAPFFSFHVPPHLSSSRREPLGIHLSPSHLFALAFFSVSSDRNTMSLLDYLGTAYSIYKIHSSFNSSGKPSVFSPGQQTVHFLALCSHLSTISIHPLLEGRLSLVTPWPALRGLQSREYVFMFIASTPGAEFAIEERRKEGEKEREAGKERKEVIDIDWLLLSIYFPLLWLPVREFAFPVFNPGLDVWLSPLPAVSLIGPKKSQCLNTLTTDWFRDWCVAQSEIFSESSGKARTSSFMRRIWDTFFLPDWYE